MKYDQNKVGDLLQPVAKLVGDVTRDLHKLVDPKVGFHDHDDDAGGGGVGHVDDDVIAQAGEPVCRWEKKKWCEPVSFIITIMIMYPYTAERRDVLENTPPEAQEISQGRVLYCIRLNCMALHGISLYCTVLHSIELYFNVLHVI